MWSHFVFINTKERTMIEQKVTVNFFLDKSRPNAENKCLIKLNIYTKGNKKRYATSYHVTTDDWEKLNNANLRDVVQNLL